MGQLEPWQLLLAAIMGVFALLTAGLPFVFWHWHRQDAAETETSER